MQSMAHVICFQSRSEGIYYLWLQLLLIMMSLQVSFITGMPREVCMCRAVNKPILVYFTYICLIPRYGNSDLSDIETPPKLKKLCCSPTKYVSCRFTMYNARELFEAIFCICRACTVHFAIVLCLHNQI